MEAIHQFSAMGVDDLKTVNERLYFGTSTVEPFRGNSEWSQLMIDHHSNRSQLEEKNKSKRISNFWMAIDFRSSSEGNKMNVNFEESD